MTINLLETVQQNLGYPPLQKIDPNTQEIIVDKDTPDEDKFSQAAIPAILTGLYEYVRSDEGADEILKNQLSANWMTSIFDDNKKEALQNIAAYARQSNEDPQTKMNAIAAEAVKTIKENLPADATREDLRTFLSSQKNTILLYLPAALNMGELLNDNILDDETNKMEGPVSNLIRNIGETFSTTSILKEKSDSTN